MKLRTIIIICLILAICVTGILLFDTFGTRRTDPVQNSVFVFKEQHYGDIY